MEKIVSPGVFTRENDASFLAQGVGNIGAAIIGPFKKGPTFVPTIVNTQSEFEEIFGTPDGTYYTGYTVQNYLREAGTVTIVRVGHYGGYDHTAPIGITISGSDGGYKLIAALFGTSAVSESAGFSGSTIDSISSSAAFSLTVINESAISASVLPSATNDIADVWGESPYGTKSTYVYNYFESEAINQTTYLSDSGSITGVVELPIQSFLNSAQYATTPWIQSQLISSARSNLFRFHTLGDGTIYNKEYKISIYNVKAATSSRPWPTFSILVRGYSDTDKKQVVNELYHNLSMNPADADYIVKVIGDQNRTIDSLGKITENGDYTNRSKYIRVEVVAEGSFPQAAAPFAHAAYINPINITGVTDLSVPPVVFSTGSYTNSSTIDTDFAGIDLETTNVKIDNAHYLSPIPTNAVAGDNTVFSFDAVHNALIGGVPTSFNFGYSLSDNTTANINKRQFTVAFQDGFDGTTPTTVINLGSDISTSNSQGFNLTNSTSSGSIAYLKATNAVQSPDDYDINLVSAPGVIRRLHSYSWDKIVDMVESREDAFFIGDITGQTDSIALATTEANLVDSSYVGTYYPWVKTIDRNTNKLTAVPPSVLMPGIYAANDAIAAEWWAPAGLNRGGIVGAVSVINRLTHAERDELYENKVNPIAVFPGQGIAAYGQKTLQEASSALDRIGVRRLLIKVKKYIASTSRYLVFEQNTASTRNKFLNTVNPYLDGIQQRQGLYTFKVVMDETNNTPDVIDRNILKGSIWLQPTKTAEFIVLDFNIVPTGAQFSG